MKERKKKEREAEKKKKDIENWMKIESRKFISDAEFFECLC